MIYTDFGQLLAWTFFISLTDPIGQKNVQKNVQSQKSPFFKSVRRFGSFFSEFDLTVVRGS